MQNNLFVDHGKATPIGNYVSGPPPACIFENMKFREILRKYIVAKCPHQIFEKGRFQNYTLGYN